MFAGMLTGDDKLAAFAVADLFVLPSYSEGFSVAVLEALAAGPARGHLGRRATSRMLQRVRPGSSCRRRTWP